MSTIFSIWTVVVFVFFIGLVFWTYSSKRKEEFDQAAHIPFDEYEIDINTKNKLLDNTLAEKDNG